MAAQVGGLIGVWFARSALQKLFRGLFAGLFTFFRSRLGLFVATAMVWLGINFGTVKIVVEPALDLLYGYAQGGGATGQFGTAAMQWLGVMNFDRAITMIGSAVVTKKVATAGRLFLFKKGFGAKP